MTHCEKCGANTPWRKGIAPKRCVHCHADLIVFVGTVALTCLSYVWGI